MSTEDKTSPLLVDENVPSDNGEKPLQDIESKNLQTKEVKPPVVTSVSKPALIPNALEKLQGEELAQAFSSLSVELAYGMHVLSHLGSMLPGPGGILDRSKYRIYQWTIGSMLSLCLNPDAIHQATIEIQHVFGQYSAGVPHELLQVMRRPSLTMAVDHLRRDSRVLKRIEADPPASRVLINFLIDEFKERKALEPPKVQVDNPVSTQDSNTMIVLKSIGDSTSQEGQDAINRFGKLLAPLPLKGMNLDPDQIWLDLQEEFPWMTLANLHIAQSAAVAAWGKRAFRSQPILLVGPPGIGKTRWGRKVAEKVGLGFSWLSMSGMSSSMSVVGNERGYKGARPGFAASSINAEETANPLLLLDEVDKATQGGHNGDPIAALLPLMESTTAKRFPDNFLLGELDLSKISWVLTANEETSLPETLLSRLKIVRVGIPDILCIEGIIQRMLAEFAEDNSIPIEQLPSIQDSIAELYRVFQNTDSLRELNFAVIAEISKRLWYPSGFDGVINAARREFRLGFTHHGHK